MKRNYLSPLLAAGAIGIAAAGCHVYVRESAPPPPVASIEVNAPPPPAQVDVETPMPGPGYVWIGGVWAWGPYHQWVWQRGHWDRPPHVGAVWVPDRYEYRRGHHVFIRGRWR